MPRILKSLLNLAKRASQPGLTRQVEPESGVQPIPAKAPKPADPGKCQHVFASFVLPAEGKGRVYQCQLCRAIGFKLNRFGGPGMSPAAFSRSIKLYTCSRYPCKGVAVRRMTGRGPRGSYVWACFEHGTQIEGQAKAP